MSENSSRGTAPEQPPVKNAALLLLGDTADTAWRMFVPTVGLTIAGLALDKRFDTTPWIMILGIILGSVLAGLLVRRQLQRVNQALKNSTGK